MKASPPSEARIRVALVGPPASVANAQYGGGAGGYVRNMQVYLSMADVAHIDYVPCFTTVRQRQDTRWSLILRFFADVRSFWVTASEVQVLHVLAQYRGAIVREWAFAIIASLLARPLVYEIKAGAFVDWYSSSGRIQRWMVRSILSRARLVLAEGLPVVDFLKSSLGIAAQYLPNVVPACEVPGSVPARLTSDRIRVLFTGFAYRSKGVFDLVEGFAMAYSAGVPVELSLVGAEEESFRAYLDQLLVQRPDLPVRRLGIQPHPQVIAQMLAADVLCMPTFHPGEGHNNSVNEGLMTGMLVVCTRHGFLPSILSEREALFVNKEDPASIAEALKWISTHREAARQMAHDGHALLQRQFVAEPWFAKLGDSFRSLVSLK